MNQMFANVYRPGQQPDHYMDRATIEINPDKSVYVPSDIVLGTVLINCPRAIEVDSIQIRLIGEATANFTTDEHYEFVNHRVFVDETKELWQHRSLNDMLGMLDHNSNNSQGLMGRLIGGASFKFQFHLPSELSTSFYFPQSPVNIKYRLQVRLFRCDEIMMLFEHAVVVLAPVRVNKPLDIQRSSHSKHYRFPKERSIYLECILPRSVFSTTDRIQANIIITNRWKQSLKYVHMSIVRNLTVHGYMIGNKNITHEHVAQFNTTGVGLPPNKAKIIVGESYTFSPSFNIPALQPNMVLEDFMKSEYFLKIAIGRAHNYVVATLKIPITIIATDIYVKQQTVDPMLVDLSIKPIQSIQPMQKPLILC